MQLFLWAEGSEDALHSELLNSFPGTPARRRLPGLLESAFDVLPGQRLPHLAFARQWLPDAQPAAGDSIREWTAELFRVVTGHVPENEPWSLAIAPQYGSPARQRIGARAWHRLKENRRDDAGRIGPGNRPTAETGTDVAAGRHRCELIRQALVDLLRKRRRRLLQQLRRPPCVFTPADSFVQLLLTAPTEGFISVAIAPLPFEQRHLLSPFVKGELPVASDPTAPSRAFAKLLEAEQRLGRSIQPGDTCVDLGAAPGSWTYVAAARGACVTAVDRSPLREDLMLHQLVRFQPSDAFSFQPSRPVDWLLCDVIAPPERTAGLLVEWLRRGWCRHFVVTVKLGTWHGNRSEAPGTGVAADVLVALKRELGRLTREFFLTRLCANKNEVCAFGSAV